MSIACGNTDWKRIPKRYTYFAGRGWGMLFGFSG